MSTISELLNQGDELGKRLAHRLDELESQLHQVVRIGDEFIDTATSHLSDAGGKRLRPLLCMLTAELGSDPDSQKVFDSALVVELTHLASLYHDDVIDDAPLRRGVPSAQNLYGNRAAIMAGDVLFARASSIVAGLGPAAVRMHAEAFERLCMGELHETAGPREGDDPIYHYLRVLADKTGSLIAVSARSGVLASGGSEDIADIVAEYGELVGVAFQIADDVIDLISDRETTGKTPGTDLLEGVDTMPILLLRERAARAGEKGEKFAAVDPAGAEILKLLDTGDLVSGNNLERAVMLLREHIVLDETKRLAQKFAGEAIGKLTKLPHGEVRSTLESFATMMVDRLS